MGRWSGRVASQVHPGPLPRLDREVHRTSRSRAPGADQHVWPCTSTHHLSGVPGIQVCLLMNAFRALVVVGPTCDPGSPSEEEVPGVTSWRSGLTRSFLLWCSRHTPSPSSPSTPSTPGTERSFPLLRFRRGRRAARRARASAAHAGPGQCVRQAGRLRRPRLLSPSLHQVLWYRPRCPARAGRGGLPLMPLLGQ